MLLAAFAAAPLPAVAQLSAGDPIILSTQAELTTFTTDVAIRSNGSYVVVWDRRSDVEPFEFDVQAQRFGANGTPLGGTIALATHAAGDQSSPSVATGRSDRFLVAWHGEGSEDPGGVYARLFEKNGTPVGDAFLLHSPTPVDWEFAPSVARDGDGFVVAWLTYDSVHVSRLNDAGSPRGGFSKQVNGVKRVSVDGLPGGRLVVAWSSVVYRGFTIDSEGDVGHVDGVILSATGEVTETFWANERQETGTYNYVVDGETRVSLAASASGLFATAYDSAVPYYVYNADAHDGGYPLGAKIERFDGSAATLGSYYLDNLATSGRTADVAMTPGGNSVAAIEGDRMGIRAIDCHGLILGDDLLYVSGEDAPAVSASSIAINEHGNGVVVWAEARPGEDRVLARRIDLGGGCALCGDADLDGRVTVIDGLIALRTAVGAGTCALDRCDTDGSSKVGSRDALDIVRFSVSDAAEALPCSGAPQIELSASAPVPQGPDYFVGYSPFALASDSTEAVLVWTAPYQDDGTSVLRRFDGNLAFSPAELVAGPEAQHFHVDPAVCSGDNGLAFAWTSGLRDLPPGITVDLANVMLELPGVPAFQANQTTFGSQRRASIARLDGGRYAISWVSECEAIERKSYDLHIRPDECDSQPANGAYVQLFDADGSLVRDATLVFPGYLLRPTVASIDGDRFVVTAGDAIQVRSSDGELLGEMTVSMDRWLTSLSCVGTRCARANTGSVVLFDANNLEEWKQISIQPDMQLGPARTIDANLESVACDAVGTCVAVWMMDDETWISDYVLSEVSGIYARPFDLESGETGELIRLRSANYATSQVLATAIAPGTFTVASDGGYEGMVVHRIDAQ